MSLQPSGRTAELIDKLVSHAQKKLPKGQTKQVEAFLRQYYLWVSPGDLLKQDILDLSGAALAHWQLARQRSPGEAKVRVYNPQFEKHGWQSSHTIVEIVTDDMPFLVDSAAMALNRYGLTIHLTIHPVVSVRRSAQGKLLDILPSAESKDGTAESFMHFQIDKQTETPVLEKLATEIRLVLEDVNRACTDWKAIREKVLDIIRELD